MSNTPTLVRRSQIGELLVAEGKLSREELAAALAYREERGLKLGQALVALHLVTQHDLARALRSQGRVHCLNLTQGIVDPDVARLLPEDMARQYVALPVHRVAGRVTVAMEDPAEEYDVAAIALALGEPVFAVHADPERILEQIERIHGGASGPPAPALEGPRFTLVRGPLPAEDPDEAAAKLVLAALREARAIGAESFHVESTARGAEMTFRVDGVRTPAAVLPADWAEVCARSLSRLAGASPGAARATGTLQLDGEVFDVEVATLASLHGPCARLVLQARSAPLGLDDLPLESEERATVRGWLAGRGVVLVAGPARAACDGLAADLAGRAAGAGRRLYRLGSPLEACVGAVAVPWGSDDDQASGLRAIGEQAPDVVDTGVVRDLRAWDAVIELARGGALVIARVEARDGADAWARLLRHVDDPSSAASLALGAVSVREVRVACPDCRAASPEGPVASACPSCRGTGLQGATRIAEVLDFRGPLAERLVEHAGARELRTAARALGIPTLEERGRELVRRGITNEREVTRALER